MRKRWEWVARQSAGLAALAVVTVALHSLAPNPADVALTYLLAVLLASTVGGLWSAAATALVGTTAFNFFFLPPVGTLTIADPANWVALFAFLVVAVVGSQLVARARARSVQAEARADRTRRLLDLSEQVLARIASTTDRDATLAALAEDFGRVLGARRALIILWTPDGPGSLHPAADAPYWPEGSLQRVRTACTVFPDHPLRLDGGPGLTSLVLPLARRSEHPALLLASFEQPIEPGLADAVAGLGSLALERLFLLRQITEAEAAKKSDALKSALLSSVSHELRTPLAAIRVSATALQRPEVWADVGGRTDLLRTVDEEAERLNRVIANLLCMSRIESGALSLERQPNEVEMLIWEGMRQAGLRLNRRGVGLRLPEGLPEVDCDLGLGGTALANLLDNAAKYSPRDAPVEIGARVSADGRLVAVWVDDRGPGILPGEAERIFERFYRSGAGFPRRAGPAGTGIGLSIARALVEAHGGRLWVEARPGGGSRFTTTWPVAGAEPVSVHEAGVSG